MDRRRFLIGSAALGGFALLNGALSYRSFAGTSFSSNPFTLGVASGDPTPNGVILWTRLAPDPLHGGGMPPEPVMVEWQIADDDKMSHILQRGPAVASPDLAHAVHVEVDGLEPDRWYWYRFVAAGEESPIGRTRTLPRTGAAVGQLRFAFASCQNYENGYFTALRHMAAEDIDLVIHIGDYIYDSNWGGVRSHGTKVKPTTLEEFRTRHTLYRLDPDLQAAHLAFPWLVLPDNHDAQDDNNLGPDLLRRRAAAYQAWYEHMPTRAAARPLSPAMPIYQSVDVGMLARIYLLDTRQFRESQDVCAKGGDPNFGYGVYQPLCPPALAEQRSMLGREQEVWLADRMVQSSSRWNVLASTVLFSSYAIQHGSESLRYMYSWDGFPANRARIVKQISDLHLANPVIISGDLHLSMVADVKLDPANPASATVATEFLGTSISSLPGDLEPPIRASLPLNPQVKYYEGEKRGYMLCRIKPDSCEAVLRTVATALQPDAPISSQASFVVEAGRPGAQQA
jgi:alkaline phosphatase D